MEKKSTLPPERTDFDIHCPYCDERLLAVVCGDTLSLEAEGGFYSSSAEAKKKAGLGSSTLPPDCPRCEGSGIDPNPNPECRLPCTRCWGSGTKGK